MKVAVLGASGFLGQEILSRPGLFPFETQFFARSESPGCRRVDFTDPHALVTALEGFDAVVNLASSSVPSAVETGGLGAIEASAHTLECIIEASLTAKVTKIVYLSSGGTIYGRLQRPARESDPARPVNYYGITKALEESLLLRRHYLGEMRVSVLRVANAYGPRQIGFRQQGLIGAAIACSRSGVPLTLFGAGDQVRDFVYASDVVTAVAAALVRDDPFPVYNIGTGKGTSVRDLLGIVSSAFDSPLLIHYADERKVDLPYNVLDISKALEVLHWAPQVDLYEGIEETLRA